jgi:hypothetical protein
MAVFELLFTTCGFLIAYMDMIYDFSFANFGTPSNDSFFGINFSVLCQVFVEDHIGQIQNKSLI